MARYIDCESCGETKHDDNFGGYEICDECAESCGGIRDAEIKRLQTLLDAEMESNKKLCERELALSSEVSDWQLLVEEVFEYANPSDEHVECFARLAHVAKSVSGTQPASTARSEALDKLAELDADLIGDESVEQGLRQVNN